MDDLSAFMIETRLVYGLKGAGKTSYISDCIANDFFYKDGTTLILCLEKGKTIYDTEALRKRNAFVSYYHSTLDLGNFCAEQIRKYQPDRIYVEMNSRYPSAREKFPDVMKVTSAVAWINWETLEWDFDLFRQRFGQMIPESQQVTFRGCPSKEMLAPYSEEFRLLNHRASYLRQDPMGFHEKAFDLFVPYSLEEERITITEKNYLIFWLDAADHPEHYEGKRICFKDPLELRSSVENPSVNRKDQAAESNTWFAGRVVMTCCMADLQFMSFELTRVSSFDNNAADNSEAITERVFHPVEDGAECAEINGLDERKMIRAGWAAIEALGKIGADEYGQKKLKLEPVNLTYASAPEGGIILQGGKRPKSPASNLSKLGYRGMKG